MPFFFLIICTVKRSTRNLNMQYDTKEINIYKVLLLTIPQDRLYDRYVTLMWICSHNKKSVTFLYLFPLLRLRFLADDIKVDVDYKFNFFLEEKR